MPFNSKEEILEKDPIDLDISKDASDLLKRMLDKNAATRIQTKHVLQHPWFDDICKSKECKPIITEREQPVKEQFCSSDIDDDSLICADTIQVETEPAPIQRVSNSHIEELSQDKEQDYQAILDIIDLYLYEDDVEVSVQAV